MRGSPQQEAGQRQVPCKVAPEKLGEGLPGLGGGWPLSARAGEGRGAGPVCMGLPLPETPCPATAARKPPPHAVPKIAPAATSVAHGNGHSRQGVRCSPGTGLWQQTPDRPEKVHVCASASGLGTQPESTLGPASPTPPFYPPGKLRQKARDLPGPQGQQWQHLART